MSAYTSENCPDVPCFYIGAQFSILALYYGIEMAWYNTPLLYNDLHSSVCDDAIVSFFQILPQHIGYLKLCKRFGARCLGPNSIVPIEMNDFHIFISNHFTCSQFIMLCTNSLYSNKLCYCNIFSLILNFVCFLFTFWGI